jgi:AraC family transcriptional regulator, transcriptional activator of pobA
MDRACLFWHFSAMTADPIPFWQLYGENRAFPDVLHVEKIADRAAGLDWTIAPHRHFYLHQVFLLLSGSIRLSLDGLVRTLDPPVVINIPRRAVHGFSFSAGTEGFVLTLPTDDLPELFGPLAETAMALGQPFTLPGADLLARFQAIFATSRANPAFRRTLLRSEATALLTTMLASAPESSPRNRTHPRIIAFELLARKALRDRRKVTDFAAELCISSRHLNRLCKAETGLSAQAFVETLTIQESCRLLVYTRMTVQQVAYHLGYDDPSYFGRVFQRNLRLSPRAYRERFEC